MLVATVSRRVESRDCTRTQHLARRCFLFRPMDFRLCSPHARHVPSVPLNPLIAMVHAFATSDVSVGVAR